MWRKTLLVGLVSVVFGLGVVHANPATIAVQGNGRAEAIPDRAIVTVGVVTQATAVGEAQQKNAQLADAIMTALISMGIDKQDLATSHYSVEPQYVYPTNKPAQIKAYQVSNQVSVTVKDITKVGAVLDTAMGAGANTVQGVQFSCSHEQDYKLQALQQAAREALAKADALAAAFGKKVVRVVTVTESGVNVRVPEYQYARKSLANADVAPSTPVEAGTMEVQAVVQLLVEIE